MIADPGAVSVPAILSDLAGSAIAYAGDEGAPLLSGFAGEGDTLRAASEAVLALHGLQWREQDGRLGLTGGTRTGATLDPGDALCRLDGEPEPAATRKRAPIETVPIRLSIRHHDPARDFQLGIQTAERPGPGTQVAEYDCPAALSAGAARGLADQAMRRALRRRTALRWPAGWSALAIGIGDIVSIADEPGYWLVEGRDWEDMAVRLSLRAHVAGTRPSGVGGDPGAPVLEVDRPQGETHLAIVELPPDGVALASGPVVHVAATGADAGWRRAALFRFRAEADAAEPIGRTAPRAVIGTAQSLLADGAPWRIDRRNAVDVLLDNADDALVAAADEPLFEGANLAMLGEEIIQFGLAEPIGPGRYRLSRLLRGWHGTEWACAGHAIGERFVLLDRTRLAPVEAGPGEVGTLLDIRAIGSGDAVPAVASRVIDGRAAVPPAPVHGRCVSLAGGDLSLHWIRRSRLGWTWPDHGDVPLGEERERYRLSVVAGGAILREWDVTTPMSLYAAADFATDLAMAGASEMTIEIRQIGTSGAGRPLILPVP